MCYFYMHARFNVALDIFFILSSFLDDSRVKTLTYLVHFC